MGWAQLGGRLRAGWCLVSSLTCLGFRWDDGTGRDTWAPLSVWSVSPRHLFSSRWLVWACLRRSSWNSDRTRIRLCVDVTQHHFYDDMLVQVTRRTQIKQTVPLLVEFLAIFSLRCRLFPNLNLQNQNYLSGGCRLCRNVSFCALVPAGPGGERLSPETYQSSTSGSEP